MLLHMLFHVVLSQFSLELKKTTGYLGKSRVFFPKEKKKTNYILVKAGKVIDTDTVTHFSLSLYLQFNWTGFLLMKTCFGFSK